MGDNNNTKTHYDMNEYKVITKVSHNRLIQRGITILNQ